MAERKAAFLKRQPSSLTLNGAGFSNAFCTFDL